ncbi:MAG: hypothetical protein J6T18_00295 [Bacteroidaceae bacterium]|nr:hypothetical protein [Bacteroidaceae bacterium]
MKRTARLACILIAVVTVSCSDNSGLDYMEQLIETNPAKADTLFRTFPVPENRSQRACPVEYSLPNSLLLRLNR